MLDIASVRTNTLVPMNPAAYIGSVQSMQSQRGYVRVRTLSLSAHEH